MKIKNVKLMLLGLLALFGMNAYAQTIVVDGFEYTYKSAALDETGRSVNNIVYDLRTLTWTNGTATVKTVYTKEATVTGVNSAASATDVATLAIPAEVTGDKGTYKVVAINASWESSMNTLPTTKTTSLSIDITNFKAALPVTAYSSFTALTSLTIKDASTSTTPLTPSFNGSTCAFKATLTTLNLKESRISEIAASGLAGYTALTGFDFGTNIKTVGASAFAGDYGFTTLTIPATVTSIGASAFSDMYKPASGTLGTATYVPAKGLTTLTINGANNTYDSEGKLTASVIPAAFTGNELLNSVTVGSTTATSIASGAFGASSTYGAATLTTIDLSGATKLATIAGAFPTGLVLQSVKLYGSALTTLDPADLDLTTSQLSLTTITLPAGLTTWSTSQDFQNFLYLEELDLSVTGVKAIPNNFFKISAKALDGIRHKKADASVPAELKDGAGYAYTSKNHNFWTAVWIDPALKTVKLNAQTTDIGNNAFDGCLALATVTGLNQDKLKTIGSYAFNGTALTELDLSAATLNEGGTNGFYTINPYAFGNIPTLTSIKLPAQINEIYPAAFANDGAVTSINLEDLGGLTVLNPIFHQGVVVASWTTKTSWGYTITGTTNEVAIPITSLTLPVGLKSINPGALQLLDIAEIVIPSSVSNIGDYALQGCVKLKKFEWNDAQQRTIVNNAFRGDDHLESVKMVTKTPYGGTNSGIKIVDNTGSEVATTPVDVIFKGNKKDVLTFTVNAEDYAYLLSKGWTEANLQFCTLSTAGASKFKFEAKSKTGEYYYKTHYNTSQAAWFPEKDFEVFSAVVEGSDVVLVPATAEGGYYKVAKLIPGSNDAEAVCVVRSKKTEADYELKNADFNDISTMPTDNDLVVGFGVKPSRLSYQYILGVKGGVVAFYRITSGSINGVYINSKTPADRLNIVIEGEATAINGISTKAAESNGAIYNLNGVRVKNAQKGVYIQNGKKFVK